MAVKKSTNTKTVKNTTQTTTAPKSTTTTIGSRPYSSPNASSANQGTTAVNKGTNTTATKIATPTAATTPNKSTNTTASKVVNTTPTTAAKVENTTPTMNTANETVNKGSSYTSLPYTTPNANLYNTANSNAKPASTTPLASAMTNAVGGLQTAAANALPYAVAPAAATGSVLPAASDALTGSNNIVSSNNSSDMPGLFDSIARSYAISGSANTRGAGNLLGATTTSDLDVRRPYSNPNYLFGEDESENHHGGGGGHAFGESDSDAAAAALLLGLPGQKSPNSLVPDGARKGNIGEAIAEEMALNSLLDTLSAEVPGASPYSPYYGTSEGNRTSGGDINYGGSSSSSSSSSSGGGTRGIGGSTAYSDLGELGELDISALYDLLNQRRGEYDANYTSLLDLLANHYGDLLNSLGINYSDTEALLNNQFTNSKNELEAARRRALQEAYISRMMQEKSLADQLDAYGLTGGASESVMANINNNYANNRYAVEENLQNNLRDLLQKYLENLSGARERYNNSLMNAQNNRYNALVDAAQTRTNARANAYEDLYNTLANLTMKGIRYGG